MIDGGASSIFLTIAESFAPESGVFRTLRQIEGDSSARNGTIRLALKSDNEYFAFDGERKQLRLRKALDREQMGFHNRIELEVVCNYIDAVTHQWQEILIPIKIVVTDVNDNAPRFHGTPYSGNVSEVSCV